MNRVKVIANHVAARPGTSPGGGSLGDRLIIHPTVKAAFDAGKPVVALESTIITHGMPWPQNLDTAVAVEDVIRSEGAVPATIAIVSGTIHVGCDRAMLERLAKMERSSVRKCSRRDLALVLAEKGHGSTTVAATMYIAELAGIKVFVTGGIGGVHRGFEATMDVSADLTELGRTPVTVVCAGAKSILDIPRTLEFLETQGVTVVGYGTEEFPAFFTRKSGHRAPCRLNSAAECGELVAYNARLGLRSGIVIGVPVPEEQEGEGAKIEQATKQALKESVERGISGRDVTPFLLGRITELSGGESLRANVALIKNNAKVGAAIAVNVASRLNA